ncbi:hybrid sensor histidine kinase/response regulator [Desulfogranum mediterraneum]|uniref:hybrid sensor histidine kinase/response regulator n=1 Tax=Desulfogranum mediterraneum TaxID=160661 RepID=UPI000422B31D|nr:response regulator [Desulfogranum mediterraneum]
MVKISFKLTVVCVIALLLSIVYNYFAILADVKTNSLNLLQKNAATSGLALERLTSEFDDDLNHLITTGKIELFLSGREIDSTTLTDTKRFYSKYKNLIDSIRIGNTKVYRVITHSNLNYFEISPLKETAVDDERTTAGRGKVETFTVSYQKRLDNIVGSPAEIELVVNVPRVVRKELNKYYTMSHSWYWLINSDGRIVTSVYSEADVDSTDIVASGLAKIVDDVVNNYQGTIEHEITGKETFQLLTAYFPISLFNKRYGVLFSADKGYIFKSVIKRTIIITACFIGVIILVVASFSFIIRRQNQMKLLLKAAKEQLEDKVRERTAELQESEEKYRLIFERSEDPMLLIDGEHFIMANQATARSLGYESKEDVINVHPSELSPEIQPDGTLSLQKADEMMAAAFAKGYHRFEWQHKRRNGEHFSTEVSLTRIPYDQHEALLCLWRDITERTLAEEKRLLLESQLQQSQKMEAIGLMAGGVAHDLNNILAGVVGYPEILLMKLPADSELRKPLEAIMDSGQRAAAVVTDLLTISRDAASAREVKNLNLLISEYFTSPECEKLKSVYPLVTFGHELEAEAPHISCSPVHIKKCLMNLSTNAAEVINGPGKVTISSHIVRLDQAGADGLKLQTGEYVVLSVEDTGSGISGSDLEHIFEPFYSTKVMGRSGTGLGLTVVWNTLLDHNGTVQVKNSRQGACFELYFPLSTDKITTVESQSDSAQMGSRGEHILVIDDEPHLRDIAAQMLESLGYRVDTVGSGEAAIDFLSQEAVDLLVIDMLMEPGMNGRQTYEKVLSIHPHQKAVIVSGFSISEDVKAALRLGAGGFIKKPYTRGMLAQAVRGALDS